jgi:hypothetical protein
MHHYINLDENHLDVINMQIKPIISSIAQGSNISEGLLQHIVSTIQTVQETVWTAQDNIRTVQDHVQTVHDAQQIDNNDTIEELLISQEYVSLSRSTRE